MQVTHAGLWTGLLSNAPDSMGLRDRLCAGLRHAMRTGILAVGARLPASRVLAQDLGVSRVTVEGAYTQLEAEGYVLRHTGRGSFVATPHPIAGTPGTRPQPPSRQARASAMPTSTLSKRGQALVNAGGCHEPLRLQAFAAGSPDLRAFDHAQWRKLTARQLRTQSQSLMRYGDPQGRQDLREAIAMYLVQSRAVACTAAQIQVLTSSQQAVQLLAALLVDPGQRVWVEDPGYRGARTAFESSGATLVHLPVDSHGLIPDFTLPPPRLIYLTPTHQYPTGHTLSLERRMALVDYARRNGCWIIEDDYDSEFLYDERPTPSLQGLDGGERVIYVGTFSKTLFPSLRLAYAVMPSALLAPMVTARSVADGHSAQLAQAVTAEFMAQGYFIAHLRHMRRLYRSRRDLLLSALSTHCPWAEPLPCAGGLQLGVRLPQGNEARLTAQAAHHGIATPSLSALYASATKIDGWLLGFAALQPAEIEAAVAQLGQLQPE